MAEQIAIIGAGLMGHALAADFARHGFAVTITDRDPDRRTTVRERIAATLAPLEVAGLLPGTTARIVAEGVMVADHEAAAAKGARFVLEAVNEELQVKRAVFATLDRACPPDIVLASNTSGLTATALSNSLVHPERVVVTHYFNPPHLIPAVEVVPGRATSTATVEIALALLRQAGKSPVLVRREIPGFIANRLQAALLREAIALVDDDIISPEDLDTLVKASFGRRLDLLGPFEVLDFAGVDVWRDIASYLFADIASEKVPPRLLVELAAAGRFGVKSGHGVYEWPPAAIEAAQRRRDAELVRQLQRDQAPTT